MSFNHIITETLIELCSILQPNATSPTSGSTLGTSQQREVVMSSSPDVRNGKENPASEALELKKKMEATPQEEDHFDLVGSIWANKLRTLTKEMQLITEKAVNDVLFEAQTGTLSVPRSYFSKPYNPTLQPYLHTSVTQNMEQFPIPFTPFTSMYPQYATTSERSVLQTREGKSRELTLSQHPVPDTFPGHNERNNSHSPEGSNISS